MDWITSNLPFILTVLLGVGFIWLRVGKLLVVVKELTELLAALTETLADQTITTEELAKLRKESSDVNTAIKDLLASFKKPGA